jgi:hypothetical protein
VHDQRLDEPLALIDTPAMPGEIDRFRTLQKRFERPDVVAHMTLRRRDDRRVPAHDVIARQQMLSIVQRIA